MAANALQHLKIAIPLPLEAIEAFCAKWNVTEFALFGSVLRDDFRPDSDIDVMVTFSPNARPTLLTLGGMAIELDHIFGREVDLLERKGVEQMTNFYFRREILGTARVVYAH